MSLIYVGKVIRPHGVRGEMKVDSSFEYKEKAFVKDNIVLLSNNGINNNQFIFFERRFC